MTVDLARAALYAIAVLIWTAGSSGGQTSPARGSIAGIVVLADGGGPAVGATVVVVNAQRETRTDEDGRFVIADLPPGTYEVFAQREHMSAARQRVTVSAAGDAALRLALGSAAFHEKVTVTAASGATATALESFNTVTSIDGPELASRRGTSITDFLSGEPGIAARSFGAANARPMIRGFDGDRVLMLQDGLRTGDLSSTSGDHAMSTDPGSVDRLEVIKGPATLLYGSSAIGGVINAITFEGTSGELPASRWSGRFSSDLASGGVQTGGSGSVHYAASKWAAWLGGSGRHTEDYGAASGSVLNSGTEREHAEGGIGWARAATSVRFSGEADTNIIEIPAADESLRVANHGTRRAVRADIRVKTAGKTVLDGGTVSVFGTTYRQREIEREDGAETVGTEFSNAMIGARGELQQRASSRIRGRIGAEWVTRTLRSSGEEALAPRTRQRAGAVFGYEDIGVGPLRIQVGGRLDRTTYDPDTREDDGPVAPPRAFTALSGAAGVHAPLSSVGAVVVTATTSSRPPALEEMYNFGPDAGNGAFEVGNAELVMERTRAVEASLRVRTGAVSAQANVFAYDIDNFVYLDFTGAVRDDLPEATYVQSDSRFVGAEGSIEVKAGPAFRVRAGVGTVDARLVETRQSLPRIPPVTARLSLQAPFGRWHLEPEVVWSGAKRRVHAGETTTDGWAALNLSAVTNIVRQRTTHSLAVRGDNLTNTEYRLHTSFLKDRAPERGRTLRVTYTARFF